MRCVTCVLVHATVCRVHGSVHTVSYGAKQPHGRVKNVWLLLLLLLLQCFAVLLRLLDWCPAPAVLSIYCCRCFTCDGQCHSQEQHHAVECRHLDGLSKRKRKRKRKLQ